MYEQSHVTAINRRAFATHLLGLGIGAALVGYADAAPAPLPRTAQPSQETAKTYRLTPHIARYYQAARF